MTSLRSRPFVRLALAALALVLAAFHFSYWYGDRERTGLPGDLARRVLAADRFPVRFWLAYPHQNLGVLEGAIPDFEEWLGAVGRLAGLPAARFPSFGPFRMPPSSGLAIASDAEGDAFVAGADVYPLVAVLARVAGKLASNPWLAGGQVEIEGRPATVGWLGLRGWWVASQGEALPAESAASQVAGPEAPAIAWARTRGVGVLPEGPIRLGRNDGLLEAALAGTTESPGLDANQLAGAERPILALLAPAGFASAGAGGMVLWAGGAGGLPALAVLNGPGGRWELPGEDLLSLAGGGAVTVAAGDLEIRAYDRPSAERTAALVPWLRNQAAGEIGAVDAWVDPGPAAREVGRIKELLTALPLFGSKEVQRWRDLDTALRPLAGQGPLTLHLALSPPAFRLRLNALTSPPPTP